MNELKSKIAKKALLQREALAVTSSRGLKPRAVERLEKTVQSQIKRLDKTYIKVGTSVVDLSDSKDKLIPKLKRGIEKAIDILLDIIESVEAPPRTKAQAAKLFITFLTSNADLIPPITDGLKQLVEDAKTDPREVLKTQSLMSIMQLVAMRDLATNPDIRRKAANDILDRAGIGKIVKKDVSHNIMIRKDDLEVMKETVNMLKEGDVWVQENG